ncbi:MAG: transketolase C-terminal domain-containing protein [Gammaproteobacteria bacterium]
MINPKMYLAEDLFNKDIRQVPIRNGYGDGLVALGEVNENVVVLCADLTDSTRSVVFKDRFPERFIEIGAAEQNLVTVAAGLAAIGKLPFVSSYAMFSPGRCWEQIRTTISYNDQNVKIAGAHAGISVGPDGATHQAIEDIAIMRVIPHMVVVVPCDAVEAKKATIAVGQIKTPSYIRFARDKTPVYTTEKTPFSIGRAEILREGKDVAIIACGTLVYQALLAANELSRQDIETTVINSHTIKPLDNKTIIDAAKATGAIVTAEEHQMIGGLGSAVCECLSENYPVPVKRIGITDRFGESGEPIELMEKFGLTHSHIISAVKEIIKDKK